MNKTFCSFRSTNRLNLDANVLATIKPLPFLLSTFYDGIVLFKRNAQTVNLLLMSILNFPPSMRYKLGVGEYTIASHLKVPTVNGNDLVESFLFQQLLSDELNMLSDGIYVNIDEKPYYILGEMVNIQADTIALNKISGCQAAHNSIWGCYLCGNCHGRQCTNLKKRLYNGLRVELNILNPLRYFGQTGSCCKKNFYPGNDPIISEEYNNKINAIERSNPVSNNELERLNKSRKLNFTMGRRDQYMCITNENVKNQIFNTRYNLLYSFKLHMLSLLYCNILYFFIRLTVNGFTPTFCNDKNFPFSKLFDNGDIYYPCCDFREETEVGRVTSEEINRNAIHAMNNNLDSFNGTKRLSYLVYVKNIKWNDYSYEAFHVIYNCCDNLLSILLGTKATPSENYKICRAFHMHPMSWYLESPYWLLNNQDQYRFDANHLCINIPSGHRQTYTTCFPIKQFSNTKGINSIHLFTNFILYCLIGTSLKRPAYIGFIAMFKHLLNILTSSQITNKQINNLQQQIVEFDCLKEGLFPPSEDKFIWHQLIELPTNLAHNGPLR